MFCRSKIFSRPGLTARTVSFLFALCCMPVLAHALTFNLNANSDIVGHVQSHVVRSGETLSSIGRIYGVGAYEMKEANPHLHFIKPKVGATATVPTQFVLPSGPRKGIVINVAEMRLYYYHPNGREVSTFPVGIGKMGWDTPIGTSKIVRKRENPWWVVPKSILDSARARGESMPTRVAPGPENPLGNFAMNTGFKNIVIHGTPYPNGVGLRTSHGCIRMLNRDIEQLFSMTKIGTTVRTLHEPNKVGRVGNELYLESHLPLTENHYRVASVNEMVQAALRRSGVREADVSWQRAKQYVNKAAGYPKKIGTIVY